MVRCVNCFPLPSASHDRVDLKFGKALLKLLDLRLACARPGEQSCRPHLAEDINLAVGKLLEDDFAQFDVCDTCHKRASHKGYCFTVDSVKSRRHLNRLNCRQSDRSHNIIFHLGAIAPTCSSQVARQLRASCQSHICQCKKRQKPMNEHFNHRYSCLSFTSV